MLWTLPTDPAGAAVATPAASSAILVEEEEGGRDEGVDVVLEEGEEEEGEEEEAEEEEEEEEEEDDATDGFACFVDRGAARGTSPVIPTSFTCSLSFSIFFISASRSFDIVTSLCIAAQCMAML